ncbi:uncharacterized protein LOC129948517 [Eupeodes corollae]|uniref:uncharacterized protein LOC129948517 n=1 Tax=Eupeodes corollae TaxID=290404 RepID=UPI002491A015|nr:uncharacterized protein LOC129948517 [Eupeodes corollae]
MSSTEISPLVTYGSLAITTRCGEIYCCENLNNFVVNCDTCSQQFNLLSCTLFIKHIKKCKTIAYGNFSDHNSVLQDDFITNDIDSLATTVDPLTTFKLEVVRDKDQGFNELLEESQYSDFMDEDELPIEKIIRRKETEGIIIEYKKHPILWDPDIARSSTDSEKEEHYRQIVESVNSKFKMNITYCELYQQILTMRTEYRKVLERKQRFNDDSTKLNPKPWYFENLSFIQGDNDDIQVELPSMDNTNTITITKQEPYDSETSCSGEQPTENPGQGGSMTIHDPIIISELLTQYKQNPLLWDQSAPHYNNQNARKDAYGKIVTYLNTKFNKNITERIVKQQLLNLRKSYRRVQRKKNSTGNRQHLWYFDHLSFIDKEIPINYKDCGSEDKNKESDISMAIIQEYKKHPRLYNNDLYQNNCRFSRTESFNKIRSYINSKFNTNYTNAMIRVKICRLRSSYRRILRSKEEFEKNHANSKEKFHPQWKYFDKLSFIGTKDSDFAVRRIKPNNKQGKENKSEQEVPIEYEESRDGDDEQATSNINSDHNDEMETVDTLQQYDDHNMSVESDNDKPYENDYTIEFLPEDEGEQFDQLENVSVDGPEELQSPKSFIKNKEIVTAVIEEYQKLPCLWDFAQYSNNQNFRREAFQQLTKNINDKFNTKYKYQFIRNKIFQLRSTYERMLKTNNKYSASEPKLWYAKKLSFIQETANQEQDVTVCDEGNENTVQTDKSEEDNIEEVELPSFDDTNSIIITKHEPYDSDTSGCVEPTQNTGQVGSMTIHNPILISELIAQYKQYALLWDHTDPLYNNHNTRKGAYCKIAAYINIKFNKQLTDTDVKQQIINLRKSYRRVQRRKQNTGTHRQRLWYFDSLSFVDKNVPIKKSDSAIMDYDENSTIDYKVWANEDDKKVETSTENRGSDITMALIEEYKKHPRLYNNSLYKTNCRVSRAEGFTKIRTNINNKFNTSYTNAEIRVKICHLRSSYRRILRAKEEFEKLHANSKRKFLPQWKYFHKLSFIGTKDSDFPVSRINPNKKREKNKSSAGEEAIECEESRDGDEESLANFNSDHNNELGTVKALQECHDYISVESDNDDDNDCKIEFLLEDGEQPNQLEDSSDNGEEEVQSPKKSFIRSKELVTAIIEEYQNLPCLWDVEQYTTDNNLRREAFQQLTKNINDKFNKKYNYKYIRDKIVQLRSSYKRMLRRKEKYPTSEPKLWYAKKLSFIGGIASQEQDVKMCNEGNSRTFQTDESEDENMEEVFNRKNKILTQNMVFVIIDLYKTAPILWDNNNPLHVLRTERRKAIKKLTEIINTKYEVQLTVEDFRYHIRSLRDTYYRALRQEKATREGDGGSCYAPKPFFFDRLSFLEPFADKFLKWHGNIKEPNEDFNYLVDNKPLMIEIIEVYKANPCLWDSKHKDKENRTAHSEAYDMIKNAFLTNDLTLTTEQVVNVIRFLHSSYAKQKKINDKNTGNNTKGDIDSQIWFYEHLHFLTKVHKNTDKYCSHCDQNFHTLVAYEKHKIEIAGDFPYKCSLCNAGFISRSKYAYHQFTHKEPHKCKQCDFQAYDKHNFNVHMRRHKGIHPFKCAECSKGFVTSTELNRHMRMHTGERPFVCDICGKTLTSNSEFRQHTKRHNNQRDHKCGMCDSAFYTPKSLRDHMASHSTERKHICDTCGAAFKRKKTLLQHKALHAEVKKHECKICGKAFAQKAGVYSHMKSHGLMTGSKMSSTEISSLLAYNPTPITTRCGEVYCSENLDNFIIHCGTCSQQFNLLSCTLFIKHIKECKTMGFQNMGEQNIASQDICSYTIDNLLKDALKSNNIDSGGTGTGPVDHHIDPLLALKLEMVKEKDEPLGFNEPQQEVEYLSDYMDEDELSIEKVIRRKKIEGIIDEYRKHPILWDPGMARSSTNSEKKQHYRQIRKMVNTKFKMNLTYKELHQQIINLRQVYKRVLKRKQSFERFFTDGSTKFNPKLWYFEKLSFIQGLNDDIEVELPSLDESNPNLITKQEPSDCESSDSGNKQPIQPFVKRPERDSCKILNDPPIISDLIAQYKQYPFLWDQTAPLYNSKYARKDAYRKITAYINNKFNKNVTDRNVRQQIVNLRSVYRRVQRKKHDADYRIVLWYYDDLSFIDRKANEEENNVIPIEVDVPDTTNDQKTSVLGYQGGDSDIDDSKETPAQKRETAIVLAIIEEYKEHPCLYKPYDHKNNCRFSRADAITEVRTTINNKFNTSYTDAEIKARISTLRSSYRRILRTKEGFEKLHANANRKFHPQWKYFDKLSFIGTKNSDFAMRRRKPKKNPDDDNNDEVEMKMKTRGRGRKKQEAKKYDTEEEEDEEDESDEEDDEDGDDDDGEGEEEEEEEEDEPPQHDDRISAESEDGESNHNSVIKAEFPPETSQPIKFEHLSDNGEEERQNPKSIVKNKALLTAVIEEYKKLPCLWAVKHYTNDNTYRREAFEQMAKNINDQFNTRYNYKDMSAEIVKLRATYKRMLKKKQEDPTFEPKLWYAEKLSFIEGKPPPITQDNGQQQDFAMCNESNETSFTHHAQESEEDNMEEIFNKKNKVNSKDMVFEIIDLYKTAPILWDTKHPFHMLRTERRKAIQQITEVLGREHDCYLTVEEYRYQIRFLRDSYFRALRQENAAKIGDIGSSYIPKPFFFDRLSFLEPFAEKFPIIPQKLHADVTEPTEDFTYLVENRPLMIDFIEVYKAHPSLWDSKDKDKDNLAAHSEAYDKIINTFLKYNVILNKDQVLTAIRFLLFSYVKQQKINDKNLPTNTSSEPQVWFYDNLLFLGKIPQNMNKYCSHCDQHFHTLAAYEKHRIEIAGDYPYKCSVCKAGFVSRSKYAYHQITHKEPHKCDQCGFQAYDKHNFNVHMRRHKGIHPFKCPECDKGFVTSTEMNRHMRMHTGERPFICDVCGKTLTSNSEFRQHMKRHSNQRDHKCDLCGSAFFTPKTLRDHMASHSNERQHVCETCGAAFKRKKTLHQHKALHAEKKKHECKICGKMFAQKAGVYSHMKSHGLMAGS